MKVSVEMSEQDIRQVLANYINERYQQNLNPEALDIEVKSKQNYKSEWENAAFRLKVEIMPL